MRKRRRGTVSPGTVSPFQNTGDFTTEKNWRPEFLRSPRIMWYHKNVFCTMKSSCNQPFFCGIAPAILFETLLLDDLGEVLKKRNHQARTFAPEMQQPIEGLLAAVAAPGRLWSVDGFSVEILRLISAAFDTLKWGGHTDFPPIQGCEGTEFGGLAAQSLSISK